MFAFHHVLLYGAEMCPATVTVTVTVMVMEMEIEMETRRLWLYGGDTDLFIQGAPRGVNLS